MRADDSPGGFDMEVPGRRQQTSEHAFGGRFSIFSNSVLIQLLDPSFNALLPSEHPFVVPIGADD
jgi:hypothetical protein